VPEKMPKILRKTMRIIFKNKILKSILEVTIKKSNGRNKPGVVMHTYNPSTQKARESRV
jgi:hypothetical protein